MSLIHVSLRAFFVFIACQGARDRAGVSRVLEGLLAVRAALGNVLRNTLSLGEMVLTRPAEANTSRRCYVPVLTGTACVAW